MSLNVSCWQESVDVGPPRGVCNLTLVTCNANTPRMCVLDEVVAVTGVAKNTLRDECGRQGVNLIAEERIEMLSALKTVGGIGARAARAALVRVFAMGNVLESLLVHKAAIAFKALARAHPPIGHMRATAGPSGSAAGVDAPPQPRHGRTARRDGDTAPAPASMARFPATLPTLVLLPDERRDRYGIEAHDTPQRLKKDIADFERWCSIDFNTERGPGYIAAVQTTTLEKLPSVIRGFAGYAATAKCLAPDQIGLALYADADIIARFLGYLKARGVARGQLCKHIAVAKKVNVYLAGGTAEGSAAKQHARRLCEWLGTLEAQIYASMPAAPNGIIPEASRLYSWARSVCDTAVCLVQRELETMGHLTYATAWAVETAILVAMVTGAYMPPGRLHLLKTMLHPSYAGKIPCQDKDCRLGASCKGNHLEIVEHAADEDDAWPHYDYERRAVRNVVVHSKNDRRRGSADMEYTLPRGALSKLLIAHCDEGHRLLTQTTGDEMVRLFVTRAGKEFNDVTFRNFWKWAMESTAPADLTYFRPSLARTVFVEDYTSEFGVEPDMWDGAAVLMGNSTAQWKATYNPSRKRRIADRVINGFEAYVADRIGVPAPPSDDSGADD